MMKFTIAKDQLVYGVNSVIKGVSNKNVLPILQGIHVKAENNLISFTATDLKYTVQCEVSATVEEGGQVVIPARLLNELVKKLPDVEIQVSTTSDQITFNYFLSEVSLKTMDADEFPKADTPQGEVFTLPALTLKEIIRKTGFATLDEKAADSRPIFSGVYFEVDNGVLNVVATDTHRLAYKYTDIATTIPNMNAIIPGYALNEVFRLLRDNDEVVELLMSESFTGFKFGNVRMLVRLVEGNFPPYKRVIPEGYTTKAKVTTKSFADALERASLLAKNGTNVVKFHVISEKNTIVLSSAGESGTVSENVSLLSVEGPDIEIYFNAKFMADAIRVSDAEEITLEFGGSASAPGVMRPNMDESYLYLALPVRVA